MRNKKRILLVIGAVLFLGAAVSFGVSRWHWRLGGSVMDGPGDFYAKTYRMYRLFLRLAKGLLAAGAGAVVVSVFWQGFRRCWQRIRSGSL